MEHLQNWENVKDQYVHDSYGLTMCEGNVELDDSLFGRKIKKNKGEPIGHKIWIFGIIHRESNTLLLYPVDKRNSDTFISLIQRLVYPGSRIFFQILGRILKFK